MLYLNHCWDLILSHANLEGSFNFNQVQTKEDPSSFSSRKNFLKGKKIALGIGYGQSFGGFGALFQFMPFKGMWFHFGAGYYPASYICSNSSWVKNKLLMSGGIKYYLPYEALRIHPYLDFQFGQIGIEAALVFQGKFYHGPLFEERQETLWGPGILGGLEFRKGVFGFFASSGLAHNLRNLNWLEKKYFLIFDVGLLTYF